MKIKAAVTRSDVLDRLVDHLNSYGFCRHLLNNVVGSLSVSDPTERPAEFYVQECDRTIMVTMGFYGVEVRLTGASVTSFRSDRDFHEALDLLFDAYEDAIQQFAPKGTRVQLFAVLMLDGPIRNFANVPASVIESRAEWIEGSAN